MQQFLKFLPSVEITVEWDGQKVVLESESLALGLGEKGKAQMEGRGAGQEVLWVRRNTQLGNSGRREKLRMAQRG